MLLLFQSRDTARACLLDNSRHKSTVWQLRFRYDKNRGAVAIRQVPWPLRHPVYYITKVPPGKYRFPEKSPSDNFPHLWTECGKPCGKSGKVEELPQIGAKAHSLWGISSLLGRNRGSAPTGKIFPNWKKTVPSLLKNTAGAHIIKDSSGFWPVAKHIRPGGPVPPLHRKKDRL